MTVRELGEDVFAEWSAMRQAMWDNHTDEKDRADFQRYLLRSAEGTAVTLLAIAADGRSVGFLDAELRSDYVEGADSSPIWHVEGIFVWPEERGKGIGRLLVESLEKHARARGYSEISSDCELDHADSEAFHRSVGFEEAIRSIHFIKKLS